MASSRTLSVILAADAVGYSRLAEANEAAALAAVAWFRERAAEIVASHGGRIFARAGDGIMAELPNARAGVRAALELTETVRARVSHADRPALPVRIGVHLGDVSAEADGDRLGHDVNLAARIQQLAEPGEVLASRALADSARGRVDAGFERVGAERAKNLKEPIEVFRVVSAAAGVPRRRAALVAAGAAVLAAAAGLTALVLWQGGGGAPQDVAAAALPAPSELSIAVLPFVNMSADADQDYFADGLSEELMNQLAQIEGLLVTGRTSAFVYKNHNEDLRTIGATLGVAHILEGSVRKTGERLRITAQLIDAESGYHRWSQTYDRDLDDIFAVQEDIARQVADALSARLGIAADDPFAPWTDNLEAYDLFLRAESLMRAYGADDVVRAERLYREAVALDPDFLAAWAGLANALSGVSLFWVDRIEEARRERDAVAERLVAAAPDGWLGYSIRGWSAVDRGDLVTARRLLDTAHALAPPARRMQADREIAYLKARVGRWEDILDHLRSVVRADPLELNASSELQNALWAVGRDAEAEAEYQRSRDLPGNHGGAEAAALLRAVFGGYDREQIVERYGRLMEATPVGIRENGFDVLAVFDDREAALAGLRRELERATDPTAMNPYFVGVWAHYFGDADLAFEALRRRLDLQGVGGVGAFEPEWRGVRRDPRFKDIVRDYGYLDYFRATGEWADGCRPVGEDDFECS